MPEFEDEERQLRIDRMTVNIEKMRADMKWESRKFMRQALVALAASVGAGVALGNYLARQAPTPAPMFPPGTVITIPGGASR
jgi:anti-sigma-K factor RskA